MVVIIGTQFGDFLEGGDGNDVLYGELGDDTLFGKDGDDKLYGITGNDILDGGAGNDVIDGIGQVAARIGWDFNQPRVQNIDTLTGGDGADAFILLGVTGRSGIGPSHRYFGNNDYAVITDFNLFDGDVIRIGVDGARGANDYSLEKPPESLSFLGGTALYANNIGQQPELIAILQNVCPDSLSLTEPYFLFGNFRSFGFDA